MTALLPPKDSGRLTNSYGFVGAMGANPTHDDYLVQRPFSGVPNPSGHLMFGGGYVAKKLNTIGETDDSVLDEGSTKHLRQSLLKLMILEGQTDELEELKATHQWSGIVSRRLFCWLYLHIWSICKKLATGQGLGCGSLRTLCHETVPSSGERLLTALLFSGELPKTPTLGWVPCPGRQASGLLVVIRVGKLL